MGLGFKVRTGVRVWVGVRVRLGVGVRDRCAARAVARGAAGAVEVLGSGAREVELHDVLDVERVEAAGSEVRRHEHVLPLGDEVIEVLAARVGGHGAW